MGHTLLGPGWVNWPTLSQSCGSDWPGLSNGWKAVCRRTAVGLLDLASPHLESFEDQMSTEDGVEADAGPEPLHSFPLLA